MRARIAATLAALLAVGAAGMTACDRAGGEPSDPAGGRTPGRADRLQPSDLVYLGAFRLPPRPAGAPDAHGWEYGGGALAYRADGDPDGGGDGFPGSLFGTGHDVFNHVSEIGIPLPKRSRDLAVLETAATLQGFRDVRGGLFDRFDEIVQVGLEILPARAGRGPSRLYMCWGQHFHEEAETTLPTHAWRGLDLAAPSTRGAWWIGKESLYSTNAYLFSIPPDWAEAFAGGRALATGRFRDGGWSGMGPALFAVGPWLEGDPPAPGARLDSLTLLLYSDTRGEDAAEARLDGYRHSDEWDGGAWLTAGERSAVVFTGTKGSGYTWYGFTSPNGDGMPCVEQELTMVGCFDPDGAECPASLSRPCAGADTASRGWWSSRFDAQMLFYDPADLAAVARGDMAPSAPQPYAVLDLDEYLLLGETVEAGTIGRGEQRRFRLGETTYARKRGLLFVPERFADAARPVIHVFRVAGGDGGA